MWRWVATGLLASAGTLVAILLLAESGFRVFGFGDDAVAEPHPWVGWVHLPHRTAEMKSEDPGVGRRMRIHTNALGLRDVERSPQKPPGVTRVLVLGDSYVEAAQVPDDSALTRRLERLLDGVSGRRVEVWNCGVAGYSTAQELLFLRHVAAPWRPDLVVLCFLPNNDVSDHVPEMASSLRNRPFYRLQGDSLALDRSQLRPDPPVIGWLRLHSRVFGWVTSQIRVVRTNLRQRAESRPGAEGIPHWLQLYVERPDSVWQRAWEITDRLVVATRDEARRQGADFLAVGMTSGLQIHPQARASWPLWSEWERRSALILDAPERRLAALAARDSFDYLPLLPGFQVAARERAAPLHIGWVGHWNSAGHALAARLIAERIERHWAAAPDTTRPMAARRGS